MLLPNGAGRASALAEGTAHEIDQLGGKVDSQIPPEHTQVQAATLGVELCLVIGKCTGFSVRGDARYAGMWRVHHPDGRVSDMVNLSRAKDAAVVGARPRGLGSSEVARWHPRETAAAIPSTRSNGRRLP